MFYQVSYFSSFSAGTQNSQPQLGYCIPQGYPHNFLIKVVLFLSDKYYPALESRGTWIKWHPHYFISLSISCLHKGGWTQWGFWTLYRADTSCTFTYNGRNCDWRLWHNIGWWKFSSSHFFTASLGNETLSSVVGCLPFYISLVGCHHQHRVPRERLSYLGPIGILQHPRWHGDIFHHGVHLWNSIVGVPQGARSPPTFSEYDIVRTSMDHYNQFVVMLYGRDSRSPDT